jgi:hypothetical protein
LKFARHYNWRRFVHENETLVKLELKWGTLQSVTTDGEKKRRVCGRKTGAAGHVISEVMKENSAILLTCHYVIYWQVLWSEVLRL